MILAAIKSFFTGIGELFGFLNNRQLINSGVEKERAKTNAALNENVSEANEAVRSLNDPDERSRVRERFNRSE